jgi:hypothetical protein
MLAGLSLLGPQDRIQADLATLVGSLQHLRPNTETYPAKMRELLFVRMVGFQGDGKLFSALLVYGHANALGFV